MSKNKNKKGDSNKNQSLAIKSKQLKPKKSVINKDSKNFKADASKKAFIDNSVVKSNIDVESATNNEKTTKNNKFITKENLNPQSKMKVVFPSKSITTDASDKKTQVKLNIAVQSATKKENKNANITKNNKVITKENLNQQSKMKVVFPSKSITADDSDKKTQVSKADDSDDDSDIDDVDLLDSEEGSDLENVNDSNMENSVDSSDAGNVSIISEENSDSSDELKKVDKKEKSITKQINKSEILNRLTKIKELTKALRDTESSKPETSKGIVKGKDTKNAKKSEVVMSSSDDDSNIDIDDDSDMEGSETSNKDEAIKSDEVSKKIENVKDTKKGGIPKEINNIKASKDTEKVKTAKKADEVQLKKKDELSAEVKTVIDPSTISGKILIEMNKRRELISNSTIHVGNIPKNAKSTEITKNLQNVVNIDLPTNQKSKENHRGYAFIRFANPEDAAKSMAILSSTTLYDKVLVPHKYICRKLADDINHVDLTKILLTSFKFKEMTQSVESRFSTNVIVKRVNVVTHELTFKNKGDAMALFNQKNITIDGIEFLASFPYNIHETYDNKVIPTASVSTDVFVGKKRNNPTSTEEVLIKKPKMTLPQLEKKTKNVVQERAFDKLTKVEEMTKKVDGLIPHDKKNLKINAQSTVPVKSTNKVKHEIVSKKAVMALSQEVKNLTKDNLSNKSEKKKKKKKKQLQKKELVK